MKHDAFNHPKFTLAARDLGICLAFLRGILGSLWHVADVHFPAGDVGRFTNEELAVAMDYEGDADFLVEVLVRRRLLDPIDGAGRLYIHDWHEHCQDHTRQKLRNRKAAFANGAPVYGAGSQRKPQAPTGANGLQQRTTESHREQQEETENQSAHARLLPEPEPKPEPCTPPSPPAASLNGSSSSSSGTVPDLMPDGTRRLTEAEAGILEKLREDYTRSVVVSSSTQAKYRRLFGKGLTVALLVETAREVMEIQRRKQKPDWIAGGLDYFLPSLETALEAQAEIPQEASSPARGPTYDPDERQDYRRKLIEFGLKDDEDTCNDLAAAWGARLEALGFTEKTAAANVRGLLEDVSLNVTHLKKVKAEVARRASRT